VSEDSKQASKERKKRQLTDLVCGLATINQSASVENVLTVVQHILVRMELESVPPTLPPSVLQSQRQLHGFVRKGRGNMERGRADIVVAAALSSESNWTNTSLGELAPFALGKAFSRHGAAERSDPSSGLGGIERVVEGLGTQPDLPAARGEARTAASRFDVARHQGAMSIQLPTNHTEGGTRTRTEAEHEIRLEPCNEVAPEDLHGGDITIVIAKVIVVCLEEALELDERGEPQVVGAVGIIKGKELRTNNWRAPGGRGAGGGTGSWLSCQW
jgi:hypothetical protein